MDIDTIYEIDEEVYIKRTYISGGTHILKAQIKVFKISVSQLHGITIRVIAAVSDEDGVYHESHGVEEISVINYPNLNNTMKYSIRGFSGSPNGFKTNT